MIPAANKYELRRRSRCSEAQNHRCAICSAGIEPIAFSNDSQRACLIAFDRDLPKTYENSIVVCCACAGECGNSTPMEVWERFQAGTYVPLKPQRRTKGVKYPETIAAIEALLELNGVNPQKISLQQYLCAPPESAEKIARTLLARRTNKRRARKCRGRVRRNGHDSALSEAQNHRCCYCTERMSDDRKNWRFATIEHVIESSKGGPSTFDNLVMACLVCNMMRSRLKMTAYEYAEYSAQYPQHIIDEIARLEHKRSRENLARHSHLNSKNIDNNT